MALKRLLPYLGPCLHGLLVVLGLTLVTIGIWEIFRPAGWITAGLAAFFFEGWISYERKERQ